MTIFIGDSLTWLKKLPSESVNCIVTSPPYFNVRDYQVTGQYGLESSPDEYVDNMVAVFREARRVLRADGTAWINLGSTYCSKTTPSTRMKLRSDLTPEQIAYVFSELQKHAKQQP